MEGNENPDRSLIKYTKETFHTIWPVIEPWIAKSLSVAPPFWSISDIKKRCEAGGYIVWVAHINGKPYGTLLTGLERFDEAMVCGVPWIGGSKMPLWIGDAQEIIEAWARDAGCAFLTGGGREGWARVSGMKEKGINLYKEL